MADKFKVKYEVEDGYVGHGCPQYFNIDAGDISPDATDDELTDLLHELAHEDMMQKVSAGIENADEFIAWAKEQMAKRGES